ncbi:MAG: NAD(P)-dependent glycerol-3-phosphate dehydrogenase [Deltaproteobacteria bacterium]|nr:NAD(P)-dependent glycerol-3-phosphate dehydrogenase [Deltaproteobacteria bacterium]
MAERIGVLGAGSFGTALSKLLAENGHNVIVWSIEPDVVAGINRDHRNPTYLTQVQLPKGLVATGDIAEALAGAAVVVSVVPSHVTRETLDRARPHLPESAIVVNATKGIEQGSLKTMAEVFEELLPAPQRDRLAHVSGPTFALELARRQPTAVTVAARDETTAQTVQRLISTDYFRAYTTTDVLGVELGGSLKNVIAIAAGCSDGLGFGNNSRAALITRGLYEISKLIVKMGANLLTMAGLAGVGDLVLTCSSSLSRNRTVGFELAQGRKLSTVLKSLGQVAEGVLTAKAAHELAGREQVDMPISEAVHQMLFEDKDPKDAVYELMGRSLKSESGDLTRSLGHHT